MLVLTRKVGESVQINEEVTVTLVQVKGRQIRLGIKAPRHVKIFRTELLEDESAANNRDDFSEEIGEISQIMKTGTEG